jgi:hypothetical protein
MMKIVVDKNTAMLAVCKLLNIDYIEDAGFGIPYRVIPLKAEIEFDFEKKKDD